MYAMIENTSSRLKTFFGAFLLTLCIAFSRPIVAVPVTDFPSLAEAITSNMAMMKNWAEEKAMMMTQMDMEQLMSKMSVDNMNNAMANVISRTTQSMSDLYNKELAEQLLADSDICSNTALAKFRDETLCHSVNKANEQAQDIANDRNRYDLSPIQRDRHRFNVTVDIVDGCQDVLTIEGDPEDMDFSERATYSACNQAGSLMGAGTNATLNDSQSDAAENQIRLITGPIPDKKESLDRLEGSRAQYESRTREFRKEALTSLATSSLTEVNRWYQPVDPESAPISPMEGLQRFVDERDADWVMSVGGGRSSDQDWDEANFAYKTELSRKMTVMQAKQMELQLEQFKHQLRLESLTASMLSLMVEPL